MTAFWRFPQTAAAGEAPDWVHPFLTLDAEWQAGRATGHTSGSTGEPKAFRFDPDAVRASARATAAHFGLTGASDGGVQAWSSLPAAGVGGRMMWWRTRILGWSLTQSRPSAAPDVPPTTDGRRYDFAVATPQQAAHLAETGQLSAFKTLLLGGGGLPPSLEAVLIKAGQATDCTLHVGFGMTETLTHIATRPLGDPLYRPLPGVAWSVGPDGGLVLDVPERQVHALHTRDAVAPETDAHGDQGFRWLGRLDDVINTGGIKVHPAELEQALEPHIAPLLKGRRWHVAGRPHPTTGEQVLLVVEGQTDPELAAQLLQALSAGHPHPDRPRDVVWTDRFEETATGKVRRH